MEVSNMSEFAIALKNLYFANKITDEELIKAKDNGTISEDEYNKIKELKGA